MSTVFQLLKSATQSVEELDPGKPQASKESDHRRSKAPAGQPQAFQQSFTGPQQSASEALIRVSQAPKQSHHPKENKLQKLPASQSCPDLAKVLQSAAKIVDELDPVKAKAPRRQRHHRGDEPEAKAEDGQQLSQTALLLSEADAKKAQKYAGKVVYEGPVGTFYRNPAISAEDFSDTQKTFMLWDFEQRRTERVGALLGRQKLRVEAEKKLKLEEQKKANKELIIKLQEDEEKKIQRVQVMKKWMKEKDMQRRERDDHHNKVMNDLIEKQTRKAERSEATEQQRLVEREKRLRIVERRKIELEERVRECSQGMRLRAGKDKYVTCFHHHHHHMHYHHSVPPPQDDADSEGQQKILPQVTLEIEDQRRCEAESEQRVGQGQLARSAEDFGRWNDEGDVGIDPAYQAHMAHTADDFVCNQATASMIQRCAAMATLPRIGGPLKHYKSTLQRAMGTYADTRRPHFV